MKKLIVLSLFLFTFFYSSHAQCSNPVFQDIVDWLKAVPAPHTQNYVAVQYTMINGAISDGSHSFTAFGSGNLRVDQGAPCNLNSYGSVNFVFSDRKVASAASSFHSQAFAISQVDASEFEINAASNVVLHKSLTWNFASTYGNCSRVGNIIYAFSGGNMLIMNIYKGNSPIIY